MLLDLTKGITETEQYKAWKFPGGEIHFKLKDITVNNIMHMQMHNTDVLYVQIRLRSAEDIIFLCIVVDTIYKDFSIHPIVNIGYMPYQQADRDFGIGECFSLHTICNILNSLPVEEYCIFDPHSDVSPALLDNIALENNSKFIRSVVDKMVDAGIEEGSIIMLSPDAGAYKKIFKLCNEIHFAGSIETANKYRSGSDGKIYTRMSTLNFEKRPILIVDDICVGGRTFVELAQNVMPFNPGILYLAISHGIFSNGFYELSKYFTTIFTTNSWQSGEKITLEAIAQTDNPSIINVYNEIIHEQISEPTHSS